MDIPNWQSLTLLVVHFRALINPNVPYLKYREVAAFLSVASDIAGPYIALGDFNSWAPGEGDQSLLSTRGVLSEDEVSAIDGGVFRAISNAGLVDSYALAHPDQDHPVTTRVGAPQSRIDYVWISADLKPFVADANIIDNALVSQASDHHPMVTDLVW